MSADIQWMVIRNNSSFLMKRKSVKHFSKVCEAICFSFVLGTRSLKCIRKCVLIST